MIHLQKVRSVSFIIIMVLMATGIGCIQPDHWPVYETPESRMDSDEPILSKPIEDSTEPAGSKTIAKDTILSLSLDQALVMALESNSGLRVERYNPILANLSEQMERGVFDPILSSEFSYTKERTKENNAGTWSRAGEQTRNVSVGLTQKLPSGTDVQANVTHSKDSTYHDTEEQEARMGITVTQSLLQGYGSAVNLASVRQARLKTAASVYELQGITQALLADTERAYWDHVLALQEIDIFENSLAVARKQLSEVEQRIEIGTLPRVEAAPARVEVALREQALINAKSKFEESRLRLLYYILQGKDGEYDCRILTTSIAPSDPEPQGAAKDHLQLADKYRSDLQEARLQIKQNRLEIVKTRNGILPRLDLFITLGNSGYADSFSRSFKALTDDTYDVAAGLRFSRTLNNRDLKAQDLAADITLKQTQQAVENLKQIIQRDVRIALNDLDRIQQQIAATKKTRIQQEESLKAEQERFEAGTSTGLLVAQAQRDLLATVIREAQVIVEYQKALVNLYLAEGSLLERRGVDMTAL
ncbi:MAG: TolC family protein [Pseudomonadota bacterium]